MRDPLFLTLAEVIEIHKDQVEHYGGSLGMRDIRLLESAISQPQASFGSEWLHNDLYEMAAAYAFHIAQNHPLIDGNKRVALASALVFLEINGISIFDPKQNLLDGILKVSSGKMSKGEFADILRSLPSGE